jgi:DNA-directed RNA polymerase beta subunit
MRNFDDYTTARTNIFNNVLDATKQIKPVEMGGRKLELVDAYYDPNDLDDEGERYSHGALSKAVREKQTVGRRLRGTFMMTDLATGQQQTTEKLLAVVPRLNDDGTIMYRGSRYAMSNQQRLKPGIYGRVKKNEELESFVNVAKGTGSTHRYVFNPQNSQFYFNSGNSRIPLVSLLRTLGTSDDDIRAAWGDEIATKNFRVKDAKALPKLFEKLANRDELKAGATMTDADRANVIRAAVARMQIDPWVAKRTTGIESANLTPQMILAATKKVLEMSKGNEEVDDRDALHHQTIHSIEDYFAERIKLDSGYEQRNNFRNALYKNDLNAIQSKMLQRQLEDTIFGSGLAILPENPNPLSSWSITQRITKLGEGGVGSTDAIPKESRDYNASHTGFIDPSLSTESLKIGVDLAVNSRTIKGRDGRMYTPMVNAKTGATEYVSSEQLADKVVAPDRETDIPGHFSAIRK